MNGPKFADLVPRANFTDRLAAHLADVKNADRAHRLIRTEEQQKLEALTRAVAELWDSAVTTERLEAAMLASSRVETKG